MRHRLIVDVQHGLCNRLRALASAAQIAEATGRELVVVWTTDAHCGARAGDLIVPDWPLIEDPDAAALLREKAARVWSYMEIEPGAEFNAPILDQPVAGDVYVRSAYVLVSPWADTSRASEILRGLRPVPAVVDLVERVRRPFDVAVHVRMATGPAFDHLAWEAPANWPQDRHRELTEWRQKSDVARFIAELDRLVEAGQAGRIFAAADLAATYAALSERYGARLHHLPRDLYDRSARQMQYALADLILLTAAPLFLASGWSSFSETAQRLARAGRRKRTSGVDF